MLTGMLDDGAAGLRAIKVCGGTCVVQDPDDAAEPSMPRSALLATAVDHVASLAAMPDLLNSLARPLASAPTTSAPDWLRVEHAISLGKTSIEELATIGEPSAFTCPDCGGALFELREGKPLRFLCHTGHAFSLRSLAWMQEQMSDEKLWSGLRALQEKEAILRRLAREQDTDQAGGGAAALNEADKLAGFIARMREVVSSAPPMRANVDPLDRPREPPVTV